MQRLRETIGGDTDSVLSPTVTVVLPAHNEEMALKELVPGICQVLEKVSFEILVVDDGSTDETWSIIKELCKSREELRGIRLTRNFGHQAAILAGLSSARGQVVVMMDSDGQHPPEAIPDFLRHWEEGSEVVQGVRVGNDDEGFFKRWTSRIFYRLLSISGGPAIPVGAADFRLLGRSAIRIVLDSVGPLIFLRGLIPWLGYPTKFVQFTAASRIGGRTSYTWSRMVKFSLDGLMSFSIVPLRATLLLGFAVAIFSFIYLIIVLVAWLTASELVSGWASVMGLLSLLGGIQLVTIGVLGEYVGRLFLANLQRPHFVIREKL